MQRQSYHCIDFNHPEEALRPQPLWLAVHNPARYAKEKYDACAAHILEGKPFRSTNAVPGYKFKPWAGSALLEAQRKGERIDPGGDWYNTIVAKGGVDGSPSSKL
jgi:hypothetical protein